MTENQIQIASSDFMHKMYPWANAFHVPNGGKRESKIIKGSRVCLEGSRLKAMGVKKGVSDWIILEPRHGYHGALIEIKKIGGVLKPEQKVFLTHAAKSGYYACVVFGIDEFMQSVRWYLR